MLIHKGKYVIKIDDEDFEKIKDLCITVTKQVRKNRRVPYFCVYCRTKNVSHKNRKEMILSRIILNAQKGQVVDHIDRDTFNNCKNNLRFVTYSESNFNRRKPA